MYIWPVDRCPTRKMKVKCVSIIFCFNTLSLHNTAEAIVVSVVIKIRQSKCFIRTSHTVFIMQRKWKCNISICFLMNWTLAFMLKLFHCDHWKLQSNSVLWVSALVLVCYVLVTALNFVRQNILTQRTQLLWCVKLILLLCVLLLFILNIVYSSL